VIAGRAHAPSALLPLTYLLTAATAFLLAALAVPWLASELAGHYYHPRILALTHTVTLGWITLTIMGASYQLIPIVLERHVWSERLARWQYVLFVAGTVGVVGHFFITEWSGFVWSAGLLTLATAAHVLNAALSVRGLRRWTFTARLVVFALAGFTLTAIFGGVLGVSHVRRILPGDFFANLHAHVHLALLGWVLPMVIGVAARVYPLFLLAQEPGGRGGAVQLWGLVLGVPVTVLGLMLESRLALVGAIAVVAAVTAHLGWILTMVRGRRRPALDWGLRLVLAGAAFLVPATGLGLALAANAIGGARWALAYAVVAFGGWASLTIAGMMLKIVPFLVWSRAYAPLVGRAAVPTLAQLGWPAAEGVAFALLVTGMGALAAAVGAGDIAWIRAAGAALAAGAVVFAAALARVVHHLLPHPMRCVPPTGAAVAR
jgi:Cytochrome C and Quinol oxidase polypeptide I